MCGRYAASRRAEDLMLEYEVEAAPVDQVEPDFNVAPTKPVYVVRQREAGRDLVVARWGLIPFWAADVKIGNKLFNARAETVATKPAFRAAYEKRRCLVPADGWYEWRRQSGEPTQAYYLGPDDDTGVSFAGLWESWGHGDERILSVTILTTESRGALVEVHNRMPLVLAPSDRRRWLDPAATPTDLLEPAGADVLDRVQLRPVGPAVGNVANAGPQLRDRVATDAGSPAPGTQLDEPVPQRLF